MQFVFYGKGLVSFHPDFLSQFCSFLMLNLRFAGDSALSKYRSVEIFFAHCESFYSEYNFARWVWCLLSVKKVGVP